MVSISLILFHSFTSCYVKISTTLFEVFWISRCLNDVHVFYLIHYFVNKQPLNRILFQKLSFTFDIIRHDSTHLDSQEQNWLNDNKNVQTSAFARSWHSFASLVIIFYLTSFTKAIHSRYVLNRKETHILVFCKSDKIFNFNIWNYFLIIFLVLIVEWNFNTNIQLY